MDYRLTMYQQMFSLIGQQVRHLYRVVMIIQAPWLEEAAGRKAGGSYAMRFVYKCLAV